MERGFLVRSAVPCRRVCKCPVRVRVCAVCRASCGLVTLVLAVTVPSPPEAEGPCDEVLGAVREPGCASPPWTRPEGSRAPKISEAKALRGALLVPQERISSERRRTLRWGHVWSFWRWCCLRVFEFGKRSERTVTVIGVDWPSTCVNICVLRTKGVAVCPAPGLPTEASAQGNPPSSAKKPVTRPVSRRVWRHALPSGTFVGT